eukprot:TRINITY_DN1450_c0_g2_i2.p1 TRINITY_DN1450_c0_g2~~TRINITY_DN1450_c0_g2_i2.p1  ORF type:complete len:281 (-),score=31.75 TRINITY_DN1450_c0_g2_i2:278-1120(-)
MHQKEKNKQTKDKDKKGENQQKNRRAKGVQDKTANAKIPQVKTKEQVNTAPKKKFKKPAKQQSNLQQAQRKALQPKLQPMKKSKGGSGMVQNQNQFGLLKRGGKRRNLKALGMGVGSSGGIVNQRLLQRNNQLGHQANQNGKGYVLVVKKVPVKDTKMSQKQQQQQITQSRRQKLRQKQRRDLFHSLSNTKPLKKSADQRQRNNNVTNFQVVVGRDGLRETPTPRRGYQQSGRGNSGFRNDKFEEGFSFKHKDTYESFRDEDSKSKITGRRSNKYGVLLP